MRLSDIGMILTSIIALGTACITTTRLSHDPTLDTLAEVVGNLHESRRNNGFDLALLGEIGAFAPGLPQKRLDQLADVRGDATRYSQAKVWPLAENGVLLATSASSPAMFDLAPRGGRPELPLESPASSGNVYLDRISAIFAVTPPGSSPPSVDEASAVRDLGNLAEPPTYDVWFHLPVMPDMPAGMLNTPITPDEGRFALHGLLMPNRKPSGDPAELVVVIPGLFDSSEQSYVRETLTALHRLGYSALGLDMRGHGDTYRLAMQLAVGPGEQAPFLGFTFGAFESADVASIIEQLRGRRFRCDIATVHLMGYSAGGRTTLLAAEQLARRHAMDPSMRVLAVNPMISASATIDRASFNALGNIFAELTVLRRELPPDGCAEQALERDRKAIPRGCIRETLHEARAVHLATYRALADTLLEFSDRVPFSGIDGDADATLRQSAGQVITIFANDDNVIGRNQQRAYESTIYALLGRETCIRRSASARARRTLDEPECANVLVAEDGGHIAYLAVNRPLARQALALWLAGKIAEPGDERQPHGYQRELDYPPGP